MVRNMYFIRYLARGEPFRLLAYLLHITKKAISFTMQLVAVAVINILRKEHLNKPYATER